MADDHDPDRLRPTAIVKRVTVNNRLQHYVMRFENVGQRDVVVPIEILRSAMGKGKIWKLLQDYAARGGKRRTEKSRPLPPAASTTRETQQNPANPVDQSIDCADVSTQTSPTIGQPPSVAVQQKPAVKTVRFILDPKRCEDQLSAKKAKKMAKLEATLKKLDSLRQGIVGRR